MLIILLSFCATLLAILALRAWAGPIGLVDRPSALKTHEGHVPLVGGLGIAASLLLPWEWVDPMARPLVIASLLVVLIGTLDDLRPMSALPRFLSQAAAALIMVEGAGLVLHGFGNLLGTGEIWVSRWSIPITLFCVIGVMNAINMIDGLDGLAGGIAAVALAWLGLAALSCGLERATDLSAVVFAAVSGFLLFNLPLPWRPSASVFLGNAGSLLLGLLLAWCTIDLSQNAHGRFYPIAAVWILGVPLMDTVYAILRRLLRWRSPFRGDREHVHHVLMALGLSKGWTLAILIGLSTLYGAIGYFGWRWGVRESALFLSFLATFALYCLVMEGWRALSRTPAASADDAWPLSEDGPPRRQGRQGRQEEQAELGRANR